jgi:hypothetical protein
LQAAVKKRKKEKKKNLENKKGDEMGNTDFVEGSEWVVSVSVAVCVCVRERVWKRWNEMNKSGEARNGGTFEKILCPLLIK